MDSKKRAVLRSMANTLTTTVQIGKEGLTDNSLTAIEQQLDANELVKLKVLANCDFTMKDLAEELQIKVRAEIIQMIGKTITIYRFSHNKKVKHILTK